MPPKKQVYVKMDPIEHIKKRPDVYVGSVTSRIVEDYVMTKEGKIAKKEVSVSPAIIRIFIEILSNAVDNVARSKKGKNKVTKIKVMVNKKSGLTSVLNDGEIIPIEIHEQEKCYNHTLIFGHLLTGSNYDDTQDRFDISGKNGIGCKAVSVFSTKFIVEGVDPKNKKSFKQVWENNMKKVGEPEVEDTDEKDGYTKVTYTPDFSLFDIPGYTDDIMAYYERLVVDCAMITKVKVSFNGKDIPVKSLVEYAKLFGNPESPVLPIKTNNCEVVLAPSDGEFEAISFANGSYTSLGGQHVNAWTEAIFRPILAKINKPKKPALNINDVKRVFRLFVVATVNKPVYDSQSKLKLESPAVEATFPAVHLKEISKWEVFQKLQDMVTAKEMLVLKKVERKKRAYEKVDELEPANNEGGTKGRECTLLLVEGLSAKSYATQGIQVGAFGKKGRDWFGVYPLQGKIKNCLGANPVAISKNKVISHIIKAIGLVYGTDYTKDEEFKKLRYGRVMIVTDADVDGIHISSLIQNMFHALFPSLLERKPAFLTSMQTPIVKVFNKNDVINFYDEHDFHEYVKKNPGKNINKKYYKGLGTSTQQEVMETFGQKLIEFHPDEKTKGVMSKVFAVKNADLRKKWLEEFDPTKNVLKWKGQQPEMINLSMTDFIDTEMARFSIENCKRTIPSVFDGLKEGHRKVLYVCFKKKIKKEMKVASLAGMVTIFAEYHHGENNLLDTITNMACSYVGSNNIPLLYRAGMFGTRAEGGKDAAAGRYIFTHLDALTRYIFREEDDEILDYIVEDGKSIEPKFYVPIIPMVLVNGIIAAIGTGWSCNIPCYNPEEIVAYIKEMLHGKEPDIELTPWYRGFKGEIVEEKKGSYKCTGILERLGRDKVRVTELPIGLWTSVFTSSLEDAREQKTIKSYKNYSTPNTVDFTILETDEEECTMDSLGMEKSIKTTNMVLFTQNGLKKYKNVQEIIKDYSVVRLTYYTKRKKNMLEKMSYDITFLGNKKRFLEEVRDGTIKLFEMRGGKRQHRKTADIVEELTEKKYDRLVKRIKKQEEDEEEQEEPERSPDSQENGSYDYLLKMAISSITQEKINKLTNDIASLEERRDELEKSTEAQLWEKDLDEFLEKYHPYIASLESEKNAKKKKGV
jgi:DNA topoisomerase-2